ncbi:hypothetical protein TRAPUB_12701 [Trametes pubescens]|uniref:Uncharacterized protein n=1 Tax=Trametes pubescens TaxID=154538 RepID=A0A1M2VT52_TRAPU|nr:hypothetical protein TRAPUB_12701 [Trametes pubescens]
MRARTRSIQRSGQPEQAHWCTKCVRRFDDPDGVTPSTSGGHAAESTTAGGSYRRLKTAGAW